MTTHDLVASTSDGDDHGAGGEVVEVGSSRLDAGVVSASAANSPPPAPPLFPPRYTDDEFDAFVSSVWSLENGDPTRFDELLTAALAFIAMVALDQHDGYLVSRATLLLRRMEQRALWGPDHPVRQS